MFNKTLTHYRERVGIKKVDLARRVDVSLTYIVSLESGRQKPPTRATCEKLAQALSLNEQESRELLELAIMERMKSADLDTIKNRLGKSRHAPAIAIPAEKPNKIPLLSWENANRVIIDDELPIGLKTVTPETKVRDNMFALKIRDTSMAPEFHIDDLIIIDECPSPKNGEFVLAADTKGHLPLLRQFKDYGQTKILHPLDPNLKDIVLAHDKRYSITGKVVERIARTKKY